MIGERTAKSVEGGDIVGAESVQSNRDFEYSRGESQRRDPKSRANCQSGRKFRCLWRRNDWRIAYTQWRKNWRRWGRFHFPKVQQLRCLAPASLPRRHDVDLVLEFAKFVLLRPELQRSFNF